MPRRTSFVSEAGRRPFSLHPPMESEIVPEPPEGERGALDEALSKLLTERPDPYSEWWRAGLRETLSPEEEPA
jgi:hypothetical protein